MSLEKLSLYTALVVTGVVIQLAYDTSVGPLEQALFAYHPICMTLGTVLMATASILATRSRHRVDTVASKRLRVVWHVALNGAAVLLAGGGFYSIWENKNIRGKPHYTTWHSWVGIGMGALWFLSASQGSFKLAASGGKGLKWLWVSMIHRFLGLFGFLTGLVAVGLGFQSNWARKNMGEGLIQALTLLLVLLGAVIALSPLIEGRGKSRGGAAGGQGQGAGEVVASGSSSSSNKEGKKKA